MQFYSDLGSTTSPEREHRLMRHRRERASRDGADN